MPAGIKKEKMLAGETYNYLELKLTAIRQKTSELLQLYNLTKDVSDREISSSNHWDRSGTTCSSSQRFTVTMSRKIPCLSEFLIYLSGR